MLKRTKAFTDKKQLYVYKLPYYEHKDSSIYFNLDQFEDYLESQKINIKRVDLVLKYKES
jgi:hypothetical protein